MLMEPSVDPAVSPKLFNSSEKTCYREMTESLMYAATMTRLVTVSRLSQYLEASRTIHMTAVIRVFRYLKGMRNLVLTLEGKMSKSSLTPTLTGQVKPITIQFLASPA